MSSQNEIHPPPNARRASNFLALAFATFNRGDAELAFDLFVEGMTELSEANSAVTARATGMANGLKQLIEQAVPMPGPGQFNFEYSEDDPLDPDGNSEKEKLRKAQQPIMVAPSNGPHGGVGIDDVTPVQDSPKSMLVGPAVPGGQAAPATDAVPTVTTSAVDPVTAKLQALVSG